MGHSVLPPVNLGDLLIWKGVSLSPTYTWGSLCWKPEAFQSWMEEGYWKTRVLHGRETQGVQTLPLGHLSSRGEGEAQPRRRGRSGCTRVAWGALPPARAAAAGAPHPPGRLLCPLPAVTPVLWRDVILVKVAAGCHCFISERQPRRHTSAARKEGTGSLGTKKARATPPAAGQRFEASPVGRTGDTGAPGWPLL